MVSERKHSDGKFDKWRISGIIIGVGAGGRSRQFEAGTIIDSPNKFQVFRRRTARYGGRVSFQFQVGGQGGSFFDKSKKAREIWHPRSDALQRRSFRLIPLN
jgi:hypothetical protein